VLLTPDRTSSLTLMRKLKLDPDMLAVESFAPPDDETTPRGIEQCRPTGGQPGCID
jgi:hypothetical protein